MLTYTHLSCALLFKPLPLFVFLSVSISRLIYILFCFLYRGIVFVVWFLSVERLTAAGPSFCIFSRNCWLTCTICIKFPNNTLPCSAVKEGQGDGNFTTVYTTGFETKNKGEKKKKNSPLKFLFFCRPILHVHQDFREILVMRDLLVIIV